jgi:Transposase DDE domain
VVVPSNTSVLEMLQRPVDSAFVNDCRARNVTPHVARNDERLGGRAMDARTSRHAGYRISQIIRKRIEEHFGWGKTVGRIRQTVYRGIRRIDQHFKLTMVASNLTRMARMPGVVPQGGLCQVGWKATVE